MASTTCLREYGFLPYGAEFEWPVNGEACAFIKLNTHAVCVGAGYNVYAYLRPRNLVRTHERELEPESLRTTVAEGGVDIERAARDHLRRQVWARRRQLGYIPTQAEAPIDFSRVGSVRHLSRTEN